MIRNDSARLSSGISWPHYTGLATAKPIHMYYPISSCLHKFQIAFVFRLKFIFKSSSGLHSFASCISFELYLLRPSVCLDGVAP